VEKSLTSRRSKSVTSARGDVNVDFKPRSDQTYKRLEGLRVRRASVYQSLFTGSLMRDCVWTGVKFSRSDLDGIRVENSVFDNCDFSRCDIRSSHFSKSTFKSCQLEDALIDDCEFTDCAFRQCSFSGTSITESRFFGSVLHTCAFSPGTLLHDRLYDCEIVNTTLGNATVLYIIFRNCTLRNVKLNAESAGTILGLTPDQAKQLEFVYLGRKQKTPSGVSVIESLAQEYEKRAWYIGSLVNELNFGLRSAVCSFDTYLARSKARFVDMGFVKGDEVQFLGDILEELDSRQELPLASALDVLRWCTEIESELSIRDAKESVDIRRFAGRVTSLVQDMLGRLEEGLLESRLSFDTSIQLTATFAEEPRVPLHRLLNDVGSAANPKLPPSTSLIETHSGSFVEVVATTLFSLTALQVFIFLVNGCVIQLTELKQRVAVLRRHEPPKAYKDLALTPVQRASPVVLTMLQGLSQYLKGLGWLQGGTLGGYAKANLKAFEIAQTTDAPPPNAEFR